MHHFSSFNNQWYRKSIEYMQDVGRHQAVEVVRRLPRSRGVLQRPLRPADQGADRHAGGAGRSRAAPRATRSPTCAARWARGISRSSIRRCTISRRASNPVLQYAHDQLTLSGAASRTARRSSSRSTASRPPEFCSSCHKVHLDVPVNGYRWFRGFNDYDNWQASGVSGQGARSFYYPAEAAEVRRLPHAARRRRTIRRRRTARSGRTGFAAANTALPFVNHDPVQLKAVQDFLRDGQISVDVFGIARPPDRPRRPGRRARARRRAAAREHVRGRRGVGAVRRRRRRRIAPPPRCSRRSTRCRSSVRRGESVRVEVVRAHAQGRPLLSRRHRRRLRRLGRARGGRRQGPRAAAQRRGGRRRHAARSIRARISIAACSSTSTATRSTSATRG